MKDQLIVLGNRLLKNIDRVAVVVFLALVILMGSLYLKESADQLPEIELGSSPPFREKIPDEDGHYERLKRNFFDLQTDISRDPDLRRLVAISMFDAQSIKGATEQAREIENDYRRAERAFQTQDYGSALSLIESILRRNASHRRTLELRDQVLAATRGETGS
jgi:hypothetical protein